MQDAFPYRRRPDGIWIRDQPVEHPGENYDELRFEILSRMQTRHFWYGGRSRFLTAATKRTLRRTAGQSPHPAAVDLGGGCGGWVRHLRDRSGLAFRELALADSSLRGLELGETHLGPGIERYHVDILDLGWRDRWDLAFLLDVLEHVPRDLDALLQIRNALRPGGLLFVTTPALAFFWSYNDELAGHCRRYSLADFERLSGLAGMRLLDARYFHFFLSPLLMLRRLRRTSIEEMTRGERQALVEKTHDVPTALLNRILRSVFDLETPLGLALSFPWGTSALAVLQRPS